MTANLLYNAPSPYILYRALYPHLTISNRKFQQHIIKYRRKWGGGGLPRKPPALIVIWAKTAFLAAIAYSVVVSQCCKPQPSRLFKHSWTPLFLHFYVSLSATIANDWQSHALSLCFMFPRWHKVRTYKEYHSVCPSSELGLPPTPHPQASVAPPPCFWGKGNTRWRERGWESPNSDEGHTLWYSLYVRTLCPVVRLLLCRRLQRVVVYLGWPIAPLQIWAQIRGK